ncbi:right-handed parallel beta-helix repeat-containing protein [Rudaea cellulosilytica]|jgi:hypothetical protein|uniref:right-handed parallel beta-helix repeat-containing protein n=1 Tax=Rudaea cellulosilytica TaxID=540746 RepID=UPI000368AF54|nr:right-handed parallel beta-helix repeat-containing protein [Rudaea cellulosilytica]
MNSKRFVRSLLLLLLQFVFASALHAQATRTWVSGVGDDANPCSRTAPCKTWAGAISKTAPGGEIDALDPGGFGALTITKSISIVGKGGTSSTLVAGTNGFVVAAQSGDVVMIRDVEFDGLLGNGNANAGLNGIRFISGGALYIDNCRIFGFSQQGIDINPSNNASVNISRTAISNIGPQIVGSGAIWIHPTNGATANVTITDTVMEYSGRGLRAEDNSRVVVHNSVASNNVNRGFIAFSNSAAVTLSIEGGSVSSNATGGIYSHGSQSTVRLSNVQVTNNQVGLFADGSGNIVSFGNNRVSGNTSGDGAPTGSVNQI